MRFLLVHFRREMYLGDGALPLAAYDVATYDVVTYVAVQGLRQGSVDGDACHHARETAGSGYGITGGPDVPAHPAASSRVPVPTSKAAKTQGPLAAPSAPPTLENAPAVPPLHYSSCLPTYGTVFLLVL
ncbi:hypothetical protein LZ30DRAFT_692815 [Colletotrichum cereale]|nr:hypothetical protein LZ30DRAFT_692815 [Colletotrichum cereale]